MIINLNVYCNQLAQHLFRRYPRSVYGLALPFAQDCAYSGILAQGEDLFVCGHGSGDSIGHPEGAPRFHPAEMAGWLGHSVLPWNYGGRIFIAAPGASHSYIDDLLNAMGRDYQQRILGQFDLAYNQIYPPSQNTWIEAAA